MSTPNTRPTLTANQRRSQRILLSVPLRVSGKRVNGTLFVEHTKTLDRKSTRLNSSHANISYAVFCLKKKKYNKIDIANQHLEDIIVGIDVREQRLMTR